MKALILIDKENQTTLLAGLEQLEQSLLHESHIKSLINDAQVLKLITDARTVISGLHFKY